MSTDQSAQGVSTHGAAEYVEAIAYCLGDDAALMEKVETLIEQLVSERDALASRVRELESMEPAGWYSKLYGFVYMKRQPHMFEVGSILYLKDGRPAWRVNSSCSKTALMSMADLPHGEVFYLTTTSGDSHEAEH